VQALLLAVCVMLALARASAAEAAPLKVLAFGDSLTSGYGLPAADGFPAQLEAGLRAKGIEAQVIDAGVAGDTTGGGKARLDWALGDKPDVAILELGANDALRGLDPAEAKANLGWMLARFAEAKVPVLLAGMLAPRNLGEDYVTAFDGMYPALASEHGVTLYPFFLDGLVDRPSLFQEDGMHPNRDGVAVIVERMLPAVLELIDKAKPSAS
jgi:acyl-CoA thioesterase-1